MRCCCGKKDIDEPIVINDYMHEPMDKKGSFCGPYINHELRDRREEIERLRVAEKILWQVAMTIGQCKNNEHNLPDSFDDQLVDGIEHYFKEKSKENNGN